jgi:hypothetical protein
MIAEGDVWKQEEDEPEEEVVEMLTGGGLGGGQMEQDETPINYADGDEEASIDCGTDNPYGIDKVSTTSNSPSKGFDMQDNAGPYTHNHHQTTPTTNTVTPLIDPSTSQDPPPSLFSRIGGHANGHRGTSPSNTRTGRFAPYTAAPTARPAVAADADLVLVNVLPFTHLDTAADHIYIMGGSPSSLLPYLSDYGNGSFVSALARAMTSEVASM